ncbi:MAG: SGNH/GDSL hydrolase family protein [Treponema sp.]|nr:SGNH/GDSL hydrolase family protein [Treponema sp.]
MKKQIMTVLAVKMILCLVIFISSCSESPRYYVALGDSVSAGFGLIPEEESYPAVLYGLLENDGFVDDYFNMAVSGYTTTMLLDYLNNFNDEELKILKNSHIITLNIGGNNLVVPFLNYISDLNITPVSDNIRSRIENIVLRSINLIYGVRLRGGSFIYDSVFGRTMLNDLVSSIGAILTRFGNEEMAANLHELYSILGGTLPPELRNEMEKGIQTFSDEFVEIISWLKINAPKATIIVNTIYNPIPREAFGESLGLSIATNMLIESMNYIIIRESLSGDFLVTDIYKHLSNRLDMMLFNFNPQAGNLSMDIIHPNAEGQKLIAELNYETLMQSILR